MESGMEPGSCLEGQTVGVGTRTQLGCGMGVGARHRPCFLCCRSWGLENQVSLYPSPDCPEALMRSKPVSLLLPTLSHPGADPLGPLTPSSQVLP